jgi:sugar phosphate isomerase/epimerase
MPFMCWLSMNQVTTYRWSLADDVVNYRNAGLSGIGIWPGKLTDDDEHRGIDLLALSGLRVSSLSHAGGFTGSDGRTLRESVDDAAEALRLAAAIRANCLVVYPGGRNNHTTRHANRLLRAALDELLPQAEDCEVPIALGPMHPACAAGWTFLTELTSVIDLVETYDSSYLRLAYDTYHLADQDDYTCELLAAAAKQLAVVFLGDRRSGPSLEHECCPLGCGRVPLTALVASLVEAGYNGPFDVRLMGPEIETCDYRSLLVLSQRMYAELAQPTVARTLV